MSLLFTTIIVFVLILLLGSAFLMGAFIFIKYIDWLDNIDKNKGK